MGAEDKEENYSTETSVKIHAGLNKLRPGIWTSYEVGRIDCPWLDNKVYTLSEKIQVWIKLNRVFNLDCPSDYKAERESNPLDITTLPYDRTIKLVAEQGKKRVWFEPRESTTFQATCLTKDKAKGTAGRAKHTSEAGIADTSYQTRKLIFTPVNSRKQVRTDHPDVVDINQKKKKQKADLITDFQQLAEVPSLRTLLADDPRTGLKTTRLQRTLSCIRPKLSYAGNKQANISPVLENPGNIKIDQTFKDSFLKIPTSPSTTSNSEVDFTIDSRQPLLGLILDYSSETSISEELSSPTEGVFENGACLPSYSDLPSPTSEDQWDCISSEIDDMPEKA